MASSSDDRQWLLQKISDTVGQQLAAWSTAFYGQQRASTALVADKVGQIIDAFTSKCSPDFSDDTTFVQMPAQYAALIDQLRAENPRVYALLGARAQALMAADPTHAKQLLVGAIEDVIAASAAQNNVRQ